MSRLALFETIHHYLLRWRLFSGRFSLAAVFFTHFFGFPSNTQASLFERGTLGTDMISQLGIKTDTPSEPFNSFTFLCTIRKCLFHLESWCAWPYKNKTKRTNSLKYFGRAASKYQKTVDCSRMAISCHPRFPSDHKTFIWSMGISYWWQREWAPSYSKYCQERHRCLSRHKLGYWLEDETAARDWFK